jgi:carbon storage regulator
LIGNQTDATKIYFAFKIIIHGGVIVLILSRKATECIHLGDDIVLTIVAVGNDKVRIGVKAPPGVKILRTELEIDSTAAIPPTIPMKNETVPTVKMQIAEESKFASFVRQIRRAA